MRIDKITSGEVQRISLVANAANGDTICSNDFCNIDGDLITVVVLRAEQVIYRARPEEHFFYMTSEVVSDLAHTFLTRAQNNNLSTDHGPFLSEGLKLAESWVDGGGIWRVTLKVEDKDIMGRIHNGELTGASIEAMTVAETVLEVTDDVDKFEADAAALDSNTKRILFGEYNI